MDVPLLATEETTQFRGRKVASQVTLPDSQVAQSMKQPGGMRRQFLIEKAKRRGIPYSAVPVILKIPFWRRLEELELAGLADLVGGSYQVSEGSSLLLTFFSLVKGMLVSGILFLPRGFVLGGWAFSMASLLGVSLVCTVCMLWLSKARDQFGGSYSQIAGQALGPLGFYLAEVAVFLTQLGFSVTSAVFFNRNLVNTLGFLGVTVDLWVAAGVQFVCIAPLLVYRKITQLAFTHVIADAIVFANLLFIAVKLVGQLASQSEVAPTAVPFEGSSCVLMLGTAVYMFEGIGIILPIKQAMKEPQKFDRALVSMMVLVTLLFIAFAGLAYFTLGTATQQIVTLNIEQSVGSSVFMLAYLVSVVLSLPLILFPPFTILDAWVGNIPIWASNLSRVVILAGLITLSVFLGNSVDKYISIIGSVFCSLLAYILPSLIHYQLTPDLGLAGKVGSIAIVLIGVIVGTLNLTIAIQEW